jgi:hypothetical protein
LCISVLVIAGFAIAGEDFSVDNDGRGITEVAREVLARAGWL